ncbi:hypothetical protein [Ruania alba]|uniref:Uncharacterized protein n=1 Tax=Ruania alba TaxID=648782 RepID=A0A1H5CJS9_9MICO|nr:hypothetical protein [Ruania alba]SED66877.1 hypothetical protein SAMN04488554_0391 [Ruania alba]
MAQRFNPPPGWQVPAGFAPTQGWQPDPSWPPAPPGWNFWVDDAVGTYGAASQPGYGAQQPGYGEQQPGYGGASQPSGYGPSNPGAAGPGHPGMHNAGTPGAHGGGNAYDPSPTTGQANAYDPSPNTGQPGAYDPSMAPGGASMALVEKQVKDGRRNILIGLGVAAVALVVWIVSYSAAGPGDTYLRPWYFVLFGVIFGIRGIVEYVKAKKQLAQAQAAAGGGLYGTGMGGSDIPGSGTGDSPFGGPKGKGDDLYR